ncbi:hypothetical protein, partial [Acinetobacter sp. UBA6526]|uniref:hypothetical protein n=1 Tax=Acinetobacter sp. UBA6526 TaxID=1945950 RepID=UPI002579A668
NVAGQYKIKTNVFEGQTTAGSITVQGEGTATTNLQQGLCKAWVEFDATITPFVSATAVGDSFNITSINDAGSGIHDLSITNNMSNTGYAASGAAGENDDSGGNRSLGLRAKSTSTQNVRGFRDGVSAQDNQEMCVHIMGDLA